MVLARLLQVLFGHPQFGPRLVQRLSETRPIRAAARMVAYAYLRGKGAAEEGMRAIKDGQGGQGGVDLERFKSNLRREVEKGFKEAAEKNRSGK